MSLRQQDEQLFIGMSQSRVRVGDLLDIVRGMECGKNDRHVSRKSRDGYVPVVSGEGVREFFIREQGLYVPLGVEPRSKYKDPALFTASPKLLIRFVAPYPVVAIDTEGIANFNTVYNCTMRKTGGDATLFALAGILNSTIVRWWFTRAFDSEEALYPHIQKYQLEAIPLPDDRAANKSLWRELDRTVRELVAAKSDDLVQALRAQLDGLVSSLYGVQATVDLVTGRWPYK